MKFIVSSHKLLRYLQSSAGLLSTSQMIQFTQYFLLELSNGKLKITATDTESTMTSTIEVESESQGSICVIGRTFMDLIKSLPDQPITCTLVEETNTLDIIYESGKASLAVADAAEFPRLPEIEPDSVVKMSSEALLNAIAKTLFATGTDELRLALMGVFFQLTPSGCTFVATDGHKLAKYVRRDITSEVTSEFIVPKKPLNTLKSLLTETEQVEIHATSSNVKFVGEHQVFITKLIDAKFPNYENVIPKDNPNHLHILRQSLIASLRRVSIVASKSSNLVKYNINGNMLTITAEDYEFSNKAQESIPCEYNGTDMTVGFNSKHLIEILSIYDSEFVRFELSTSSRPVLIFPEDGLSEGEEILMLILPLMIS